MNIENFGSRSARSVGMEIAARLEQEYGVGILRIADNPALSTQAKRHQIASALLETILERLDDHNRRAGLPRGTDDEIDALGARLGAEQIDTEPNIILSQHNFEILTSYQGADVYNYVFTLTKRMENMAKATTPGQLAIEITIGGLISVGVPMAVGTVRAFRAGSTLLQAVRIGVTSIGMKTAIAAVVIALVALLLFLLLENPKKILGLIINDTDYDFVVTDWQSGVDGKKKGDLFMQHGHMADFPEDNENESLSSPKVQLRKRFWFGPNDPDNVVCAGIYFADRNVGLRGAEGVMLFTAKQDGFRFAHQFAVPYTHDNGSNMRVITGAPPDLETLFRQMYDTRAVRVDTTEHGVRMTSTVNDARGGVVALIGTIAKV